MVETVRKLTCGQCHQDADGLAPMAIADARVLDVCRACWDAGEADFVARYAKLGAREAVIPFTPVYLAGPCR